jgi:hypothetical protein
MANMMDYLDWRGDLSFTQAEFNEVDNLIFSELVYVDFKGIVPPPGKGESITLKEASRIFSCPTQRRKSMSGCQAPRRRLSL